MGRINTNVQSMIAQRVLGTNNTQLAASLERLSTGFRINRGKDDPAGLIASENFRAEHRGLNEALKNADRADQVANIAEGGLQEVSALLVELQGLVVNSANTAGTSKDERDANQLVIDSILQTIDRIGSSTNFQGIKVLSGNFDFRTSSIAAGISDIRVGSAKYSGASQRVDVVVTASAQQAGLFLSAGASALDLTTGSSFVIDVAGSKGSRELSFASGTTLANMAAAINTFTSVTGVQAVVSGTGVLIKSQEYGADEFVSVRVVNAAGINSTDNGDASTPVRGIYNRQPAAFNSNHTTIASTFANATNAVRDLGQNVAATINGSAAIGSGRTIRVNSDFLEAEMTLSASLAQTTGSVSGSNAAFHIVGGGAAFNLDAKADMASKVTLGIQAVASNRIGTASVGFLSSLGSGQANNITDGDVNQAQKVVAEAIRQVSNQRGRLGNFQKSVLGSTIRALSVTAENTAAAQSLVRDADFASETAQLTRSQILVSASTNILSFANQAPNSALQLLG